MKSSSTSNWEPPFELRDWQISALQKWEGNFHRGCLSVATGGGKTFFALTCFSLLQTIDSDIKTVVVVPTTALLDQWYEAFHEDLGIAENEIKILSGSDLIPNAKVNLVIVNTARKFNSKLESGSPIFQIVDECHRAGGDENSKSLAADAQYTLGLSATPVREYDDYFETRISKILGPILYEYSLDEAIKDGVLANLKTVNIRVPLTLSEQSKYDELSRKIGKAFALNNENLAQNYLRQRAAVSNNGKFRVPTAVNVVNDNRGKRCVVFFESIEQLEKAEAILKSKNHLVVSYHSKISTQMRRSNLRLFRRGIFDVLLACRALDEGFNVPETEIAVIAASTSSNRQRVQRIGRVLRALPGKLDGEVVTLYATDLEQDRLIRETAALHLEDSTVWKEVNI